jgi:hypothetical protein
MSLQMELVRNFQGATICHSVKIGSMEVGRKYPVTHAEKTTTKFGPTVLLNIALTVENNESFLPKRYSSAFTDIDIDGINSQRVS